MASGGWRWAEKMIVMAWVMGAVCIVVWRAAPPEKFGAMVEGVKAAMANRDT